MSDKPQWIATPSGPVMHGYSQSWAIGDVGSSNLIAGVFRDGRGGEEAAERHARLIAAAPDMLEAAQMLEKAEDFHANDCRECEGQGVPELCPECFPLFDDARIARRAAIAKATGA